MSEAGTSSSQHPGIVGEVSTYIMAHPVYGKRAAPHRGLLSIFALFSVVVLGLLAITAPNAHQNSRDFTPNLEQLDGIDFDNIEEAKNFLASKVRASTGDEYL